MANAVAIGFALWSQDLRAARVRRIYISTPAFDWLLKALVESGYAPPVANNENIASLSVFEFNGLIVLRRETHYREESDPDDSHSSERPR